MAPSKQTVVLINATGGVEQLQITGSFPVPERKPGHVLVRLQSTSVNPVDTQVRAGCFQPKEFPKVLGGDVAGVVDEADANSEFKMGDPVFALTMGFWYETPQGSYCQYASVPEEWCARIPPTLPTNEAGGVPLVGLTAWQAYMQGNPKPGQRTLVMAASGGVGHMAVQIGKALGLYVVGVAGPANVDFLKELGADEVVDYSKSDFDQLYKDNPFDIVIDMLPNNIDRCVSVLKPTGHLSHIQNKGSEHAKIQALQAAHESGQGPSAGLIFVTPNGKQLQELSDLMAQDKVKLVVGKAFPLREVAAAHQQVETGHTRGKVVLQID